MKNVFDSTHRIKTQNPMFKQPGEYSLLAVKWLSLPPRLDDLLPKSLETCQLTGVNIALITMRAVQ